MTIGNHVPEFSVTGVKKLFNGVAVIVHLCEVIYI